MSDSTNNLSSQLPHIRAYVVEVLDKNEDRGIYTNISRLYRSEKHLKTIIDSDPSFQDIQPMVHLILYTDLVHNATSKQKEFDFEKSIEQGQKVAKKICEKFDLSDKIKKRLKTALKEVAPGGTVSLPESKVFYDSLMMEFSGDRGRDYLKLLYEELLIRDMQLPQSNWFDTLIGIIGDRTAYTQYGKENIQPNVEKLIKKLKKEKKELENRTSLLLKKELSISEEEIKKLRKDINKAANRDERAIQTLFRTTIKNHYTLNEMVDRKASIMITVNSIILSILMGGIVGGTSEKSLILIPLGLLGFTSIFSIIFAIIAIRPLKTQGDFTEEEIRNKEGNLLYFGNFHNMHLRDFEWGFLQLLNDKNYLYGSMIRDFYYQGIGLNRKYKFIRQSLTTFLFGFGLSFILFVVVRFFLIG